ncbi:hypothetical protein [Frisingicoccus sp.]|uniref:hypothetical protein n=1 Tax=Frisingicoccus sp. TaxID=1918627 RepID=UPI003AB49E40
MSKNENDVSALPSSDTSSTSFNTSTGTTIPQNNLINQAPKTKKGDGGLRKRDWDKSKCKCLDVNAKVHSVAIKIYEEQLPNGLDFLFSVIRATDPALFQVVAMVHDRDTYAEDGSFWKSALEKKHIHILVRCVDRKKRIRVNSLLKQLGIYFRPDLDDWLWSHHGVETVRDFAAYTTYLTHETEAAIRDGKELYDISEYVSNLSVDEIKAVRDGYLKVSDIGKKVSAKEMAELDEVAYQLGKELGDFDKWYGTLSFEVRSHTKMKTVRESYNRGVNDRITENPEVLRLCVYIQGEPNTGKTYAAKKALSGKAIHTVEGGGTGKFDNLRADHDAIIISDDICPNLLNMTDNYICRAYKRQNNNPAWAGKYFIVTSNLPFHEWLAECKINVNSKHYKAMVSRFYICEIKAKGDGTNYLALKSASDRGSIAEQKERAEMFMGFQKKFNETMSGYRPNADTIDYSSMIDDSFKEQENTEAKMDEKQCSAVMYVPIFRDKSEKKLKDYEEEWKLNHSEDSQIRDY